MSRSGFPTFLAGYLQTRFREWGRSFPALLTLTVLLLGVTALLAAMAGAPFHLTYWDVPAALSSLLTFTAILGGIWDGFLLAIGFGSRVTDRLGLTHRNLASPTLPWRMRGFYVLGLWPFALVLITGYGILLSSNITELNLTLIDAGRTHWRDAFFWSYEGPAIRAITQAHWGLQFVDVLYVMCWIIQIAALLLLIVLTRSLPVMTGFCASYLLLYFSGRWVGCLTPVLGPVFYQPELYAYLKGTLTQRQVDLMWKLIQRSDGVLMQTSMLKGGLSAMPSLHVAMVSLCGWWLSAYWRRMILPSVLWVLATWYTTVSLGWHYISDGLGGILLMIAVVWLTRRYLGLWGLGMLKIERSSAPIPYSARH